ncbi:MAG: MFS transporter [Gammaproteobacteria bacterium]
MIKNSESLAALRNIPGHTYKAFFICLIGVTFANLDHSLFTFVLTEISEEFGWSVVDRGWYIAITFVIAGLIVTQIGVLADRFGRRRTLLSTTLLTPFFVAALTWAPNTAILLIARTLGFATAGAQSPITVTTVLEESPPKLRGLFSGILQIGFPLGFFLASLLVPWVYATWGWRYIFLIALVFLPYAWIINKYMREPAAWVAAQKTRAATNTAHASTKDLFAPEFRNKTLLLFTGQFLYVFAYGATVLLTAYFREAKGWDAAQAIGTVGISFGIGAFGYILAAIVGEFVMSRRNTIVTWCVLGGAAFGVMIWLAEGYTQILLSFCTMTFFFYGAYAVIATFIAENYPAELRATAASFAGSFAVNLGLGIGPLALSYVISFANWEWAFTWCAVLPVIIAGCIFLRLDSVPKTDN